MEWEVEELHKLSKIQPDVVDGALKELWQRNPDLYKSVVINAYLDENIRFHHLPLTVYTHIIVT